MADTERSSKRLKGHALCNEGKDYGWTPRGICTCGEMSLPLKSIAARKRWHREHKDASRKAVISAVQ